MLPNLQSRLLPSISTVVLLGAVAIKAAHDGIPVPTNALEARTVLENRQLTCLISDWFLCPSTLTFNSTYKLHI
jgi:hypothetical protein